MARNRSLSACGEACQKSRTSGRSAPLRPNSSHGHFPGRTDIGEVPHYRTQKHMLFELQEVICNGCRIAFPFRNFTVDHVVPRSRDGIGHADNLQLLCAAYNRLKGNRTQSELIAELRRQGVIQ